MTDIYCVNCKEKTPTIDEQMVKTKNNRNANTGTCQKYGRKKYMFIMKQL